MGEKKTADSGGLDLRATWTALQLKWNELTDEAPYEATLQEHERLHFQDVDPHAMSDKGARHALIMARTNGCRVCEVGAGIRRLKRYKLHDLPAIHDARGLRELFQAWRPFMRKLAETYPDGRLADMAEELQDEMRSNVFYVEHNPHAMRELQSTGRPRSHLAKFLVEWLINGGFAWTEIVQLIDDGGRAEGLEKRLRQLHSVRLREAGRSKREAAPAR